MDLPASLKGLCAMRLGVGIAAITVPQSLAVVYRRPPAEATTPMATIVSTLFGIRELGLTAITVGVGPDEPRALRRVLLLGAATDGLDLLLVGVRAVRRPALRRAVVMFAPLSLLSVGLHLRAAQRIEVGS